MALLARLVLLGCGVVRHHSDRRRPPDRKGTEDQIGWISEVLPVSQVNAVLAAVAKDFVYVMCIYGAMSIPAVYLLGFAFRRPSRTVRQPST